MQEDLFKAVLRTLKAAFRKLESRVPPPRRREWRDSFVYRYVEQTIQQAIVQKLARLISGLHAIEVLLGSGLFQEQGTMQRVVGEIEEDVWFLCLAIICNDFTDRHAEFLRYFYAEEFSDPSDILGSHSSRGMSKRERIQAYIRVKSVPEVNVARAAKVDRVHTKTYSGFVHAASPHIMDMYGGHPAHFDIDGTSKEFRMAIHREDAANYFYRAIATMGAAAKALGDEGLFESMCSSAEEFYVRMNRESAS